jgi:hypothetical protein
MLCGVAGLAVGAAIFGSDDPFSGFFILPLAAAIAVVAGFVTAVGLLLGERVAKRKVDQAKE